MTMKLKKFYVFTSIIAAFVASASFASSTRLEGVNFAKATPNVPRAVIQNFVHEFSPVVEGIQIVHDFIVQNKGNAPLIIEKVKTD
jgi:Skp family chaperone for outer membrane proteins